MLSKQLIQPPRQQLPAVTLPQNHKHINVQYSLLLLGFFFFFYEIVIAATKHKAPVRGGRVLFE